MPTLLTERYFVSFFILLSISKRRKVFLVDNQMNRYTIGYHFSCPAKDNLWVPSYKQNENGH